jgi:hypothetical protein
MSIASSLIAGAVGGFISGFGVKLLWRWYKKPDLKFNPGLISNKEEYTNDNISRAEYIVGITNEGRSVASNCKPKIVLEGTRETTKKSPTSDQVVKENILKSPLNIDIK